MKEKEIRKEYVRKYKERNARRVKKDGREKDKGEEKRREK
jgi:hypothetical protein